ncbi:alpha-beta hydrolase superfamily lysophospholipase [Prauserella shujinwangii]|uniref:Alpha-beta hydrolase superfamily lysophospholipase n=1 Tax=Prauserella shujinwangii TaxID=1453103 RepID=A0A2T0LT79_9PSEU|nr:alpha/beta hydrolase [Prauserella shujinwangii]PRX46941.1 alpha-beta hydrolase superfamily lysophospholipase [Prauserella shujinwangii]
MTGQVTSADGTVIAYDRAGTGPAVVLVHGAFTDRAHPILRTVADALAPWFTVCNYDRRGRGGSGDTAPYAVEREIEDLAAVIAAAGGSAMVFGGSSGAALALTAAARLPAITKLALWEPPYHVDEGAPSLPGDFAERLETLVAGDRRGDAVELFLVEAAEVPPQVVAAMRAEPTWAQAEAVAHTLAYEAAVLGPANALPTALLATVTQPTLVMAGDRSPGWLAAACRAVADGVPHARHRVLAGQTHAVAAEVLAPELLEFFVTA